MSRASEETSENASKLLELARKKFGTLNQAEEKLFRSFADGEVADCSDKSGENNDPSEAKDWDKDTRVIRAECIAWLCTDREASELSTHRGVRVKGARIDGLLNLVDARISFPLWFEKSAFPGGINLRQAEIRYLYLGDTHTGPIYGDGLKVEGSVYLRGGFKAEGEVNLVGATIGGDLDCKKGQFINRGATALNANRADIKGDVFLRGGFKSEGEVNLTGARIGGDLDCNSGQFINEGAYAIGADSMKVKGRVFLCRGFKAEGSVDLSTTTIDGGLQWLDVDSPEGVTLDLRSARVGILWDDPNSWPDLNKLFLHGLVYNEIYEKAPRTAEERIVWLRRQPGFWPQPYEQLAEEFRKSGQDEDARKILIAKNEEKAGLATLTRSEIIWYRLLGPRIGYGYRPLNALWGVLLFVVLGWILFGLGYCGGLITPQSESAYVKGDTGITIPGEDERQLYEVYPKFHFLLYSVDTFVPLIDLHQSKYWLPNANRGPELFNIKGWHTGGLLRFYLWFHIFMGWLFSTLLVVGLTGLVRT